MTDRLPLMIVADIDGTLVDERHEMTDRTRDVLFRLHEKGVILGLASGRPLEKRLLDEFFRFDLPFEFDFIIGLNGGQLWDREEDVIYESFPLSEETSGRIMGIMKGFEDSLTAHVYRDGCMWCTKADDLMVLSSLRNRMELRVVPPEVIASMSHGKIMFRGDPPVVDEAAEYARHFDCEQFHSFKTQPTMLEFQDPRADKGTTLREYCERRGIPLERVWAFGDMTNDNGLLRTAGRGVCMINGTDDTKAAADEITDLSNDEDGFADYIEKHMDL